VLHVINWFAARRARKPLHELVVKLLSDRPALLAVVSDRYTSESSLRPWTPLAERFGDRLDVVLAAEWEQREREREGQVLLRQLGVAVEAWPRLLRDQGLARTALLMRQKRPYALMDLFFLEKGLPYDPSTPDLREAQVRAEEEAIAAQLERLLSKHLPPPAPPPARPLQPGEHDFSPTGVCHACGDGRASLRLCPGTQPKDEPRRDRFELIELD
jgi:hypothetical protein